MQFKIDADTLHSYDIILFNDFQAKLCTKSNTLFNKPFSFKGKHHP